MTDIGTIAGTQLKLQGIEKASKHYAADLQRAQLLAEILIIVKPQGLTTDDIREAFLTKYERPLSIGSAVGAIFKDAGKWECCGRARSQRPTAHARWISVWRKKA